MWGGGGEVGRQAGSHQEAGERERLQRMFMAASSVARNRNTCGRATRSTCFPYPHCRHTTWPPGPALPTPHDYTHPSYTSLSFLLLCKPLLLLRYFTRRGQTMGTWGPPCLRKTETTSPECQTTPLKRGYKSTKTK